MGQRKKNKSFLNRLLSTNAQQQDASIICRPLQGSPGPYFRYKKQGGVLVPVDNFPYNTWESCMGIAPEPQEE